MHFRVRVEREPVADEGKPPGKVKGAKAGAWIPGAVFDCRIGCGQAKEALKKTLDSNRFVVLASPNHRALEAELDVAVRLEADLLNALSES